MNPLVEVIRRLRLCGHQYVDDMQLYLELPGLDLREAVERFGHGLEQMLGWLRVYKLRLNPGKMEELWVGPDLVLGSDYALVPNWVALIES